MKRKFKGHVCKKNINYMTITTIHEQYPKNKRYKNYTFKDYRNEFDSKDVVYVNSFDKNNYLLKLIK